MSSKVLSETERDSLNLILEDLRYLFGKEEILQDEIEGVLQSLKSDEVKSYIQSLRYGSKPETALRESFIAGKSILLKFLFGEVIPEVRSNGFIDYLVKDEMGRGIALELKPLLETIVKPDKSGKPILEKIKQWKLRPEDYKEQILKYMREGEVQFVILTDLRDWYFYSEELHPREVKYFCAIRFFDLIREYEVIGNLRDYLERKELESIGYELDKQFLESLRSWVGKLSEIEFTVDDKRKLELIIELVNKFIFIQTLDYCGVIEFKWIRKRWDHHERMWQRKGKRMVLKKFFDELDDWFYLYYDTELFKEKILPYIKQNDENIEKFHRNLQLVLGLTYLQVPFGALKGIMQYNFRYIDEDVLGKAYETFLGQVRKEEGVYYTPKYITQYIAENTVGKAFDRVLVEIRKKLEEEDFEATKKLLAALASIRILDPACGSGSFLIKAIRIIVKRYRELNQLVEDAEKNYIKKHSNHLSSLDHPREIKAKLDALSEIKHIIGPRNGRELISRIIVRHIHGNDLDKRALEVAKVNIWLEAIKLSPKEFRYDMLPSDTNYILPNLEMNLCNGDSLIGMPEESTIAYLSDKHQSDLVMLFNLRKEYLENPMNPKVADEIQDIKARVRSQLGQKFDELLQVDERLTQITSQTIPFHWALEFWFTFFDEEGKPLPAERRGFDVILGNPPYVENKRLNLFIKRFLQTCGCFRTAYKLFDYAVPFIEKALQLLAEDGRFGYIVTNKFTVTDYGVKIREILAKDTRIEQILDVSYLPVFQGTAIYPIVLIFTKAPPSDDHEIVIAPKVDSESEITENKYTFIKTKQTAILQTPNYIFDISGNILLCEKLRSLNTVGLKDISNIGYRVLKFVGWDKLLEYVVDERPQGTYVKFVGCRNIEPYFVNWDSELRLAGRTFRNSYLTKPGDADENKWKILELPKILLREVGLKLTAAFDQNGEYGNLTGMYALHNLKQEYEPRYLLALLNSVVLDFYYKSLYGSTHMAGGYLNFHGSYLENLPIICLEKNKQGILTDLAAKMENFIKARCQLLVAWRRWGTRLKTGEISFHKVLSDDIEFGRRGEFAKIWTSKTTTYPSEIQLADISFKRFKIRGEINRNSVKIYGLDENGREELAYEIEFDNRELMFHVYLSLVETLESRAQVKTLSQLFYKTIIPVITEVNRSSNELTPNIMAKVLDEFKKWLKEERIEKVDDDIVKIDNTIENIQAEIDALVLKFYELHEDEAQSVLNYLKMPGSYQQKVIDIIRKL